MPVPVYPPYPAFAIVSGLLCAILLYLAVRARKASGSHRKVVALLSLAVIFAVATAGLGVASYEEYVLMNTWTYFFELDVQPNATSPQSIIVPIPSDASLLADMHLVSGQANWSFADTIHGRGLYLGFEGPAEVDSVFSVFAPGGVSYNITLTMEEANATTMFLSPRHWVYYSGGGTVSLHLQPGGLVTNGTPVLAAGWQPIALFPIPDPP